MKAPDPQMAYAAKEEILRNIIKTHDVILIEGWPGTGKTFSVLKAVRGTGDVYYFTSSEENALRVARRHDGITVVEKAGELLDVGPGKKCIIIDDLALIGVEARGIVKNLISKRIINRKILVITRVVLDAQDLLENVDAVVRFRQSSAEMLHSKYQVPSKQ